MKSFILLLRTQFSSLVKCFCTAKGSEFGNSSVQELFDSLGIIQQTSYVITPQHNGVVQRKLRHLLNVARALKFQASVPAGYWGHCILTGCYLINMMPSSVLDGQIPYEINDQFLMNTLRHSFFFGLRWIYKIQIS